MGKLLRATSAFLVLLILAPAFSAAADVYLLGTWEEVDEEYTPVEKIRITFRADGEVFMEDSLGDRTKTETAKWQADGKILRLIGVRFFEQNDVTISFGYAVQGDRLALTLISEEGEPGGKEIVFKRVKEEMK